jgi:hypothetical protein
MISHHPETWSRGVWILPCSDRTDIVAPEDSAMAASIPNHLAPHPAESLWDQTSFLAEDAGVESAQVMPRPVRAALDAADHAADHATRREALDRLARHLTEQAVHRGRSPVPKRASHSGARGGCG